MYGRVMVLFITLAILAAGISSIPSASAGASATGKTPVVSAADAQLKKDNYAIFKRTAIVLAAAKKAAKTGHKYAGLGKAVVHQRYARLYYLVGRCRSSIYHTLRTRELATSVIKQNKAAVITACYLNALEQTYAKGSPSKDQLDQELSPRDMIKDKDAVKSGVEDNIP